MNEQEGHSASRDRAKVVVETICREIEASSGTRIWEGFVNSLNLISQVVFTRSSGCLLELVQNAEDAGQGVPCLSEFIATINPERLKVTHNAESFSETNVNAICDIRSSKKPELNTLGYLGIGFKSVFKITDCPEIHSGNFHFKFDLQHWPNPASIPWRIMPIWVERPSEEIEPDKTTFIFRLRDGEVYRAVVNDLKLLGIEPFLFLHWLRKVTVVDEATGQHWSVESRGEEHGVTKFLQNRQQHRFKIFRRTVQVPKWVRDDRLTHEYRSKVMERPIAVAFELDAEGKLRPSETVARYGGVYSFVPLGETRSGAKFAIQGDFLVQPGRDAINYEAKWNEWLLDEIVTLCKQEVVPEFKRHPKWKYQILRAFEFTKSLGSESYDRLFGPRLVQPLEQFINQDQCVPTRDGCWVRPKNAAVTDENEEALKGLVSLEILSEGEIAPVFGADADLKFAHPSVQNRMGAPLKSVSRRQLFENADYLQNQAKSTDGPKWFRALYLWLSRCPKMESYRPYRAHYDRQRPKRYDNCEIVLTADNSLHFGREVLVPNLKSGDPVLLEASKTLHERKPVLHPDILSGSDAEVEKLKGFLTGLTGAQFLDAQTICRDALLPKIVTSQTPPPLPDELIKLTRVCRRELEAGTPLGNELWVLTKHREVKPARHVLLSREYKPMEDWETNSCYVSGLFFLSADYIDSDPNDDTLRGWREFFLKGGVKQTPDGGVEEFAVNFAKEKTREENLTVLSVEKRNYGYDLTMATESGENIQVEVKGLSGDKDIDLTRNETDAAGLLGDKFFLCIVTGIPNNPSMHAVRDPIKVGKSEKLTVHLADWKSRGDKLI